VRNESQEGPIIEFREGYRVLTAATGGLSQSGKVFAQKGP